MTTWPRIAALSLTLVAHGFGTATKPAAVASATIATLHDAGGSTSTRPTGSLPTNATSVDTAAWRCIREHESTDGLGSPNVYQFQGSLFRQITGLMGPPGSYPRSIQDRAALAAYALWYRADGVGFHPWRADRYVCDLPW